MTCPSCGRTHYELATAVVTKRACPRCKRKRGIDAYLFESPSVNEARAALAQLAARDGMLRAPSRAGGGAAATG